MTNGETPWIPVALRKRDDLGGFAYVVVEELIDDRVGLVASEWPAEDDGAPRFHPDMREAELTMSRTDLQAYLNETRSPGPQEVIAQLPTESEIELRQRPIAVGDAFAARLMPELLEGPAAEEVEVVDAAALGEVIDITAEAREAAKAAMYRALTPPLDPDVAEEVLAAANEQALDYDEPA
ncbi:MAG: hypothetical protein ACLPUT_09355 [Solirubrobacteraceae bacterium]